MTKLLIRDYFGDWKEGLRRVFGGVKWFPYVYVVFIVPMMMSPLKLSDVWYYLEMGALILCLILMRMFPLHVRKTMFLCPLNGEQRLDYLKKLYRLKGWICVGICAAANLAVIAGGAVPVWIAAVIFGFQMVLTPVMGLYMEEAYRYGRYHTWIKTNLVGYSFSIAIAISAGVLNVLVWLVWGATGEIAQFTAFGWTMLLLVALLQLAMSVFIVCYYRKRVLAAAADYENTYIVWNEQE